MLPLPRFAVYPMAGVFVARCWVAHAAFRLRCVMGDSPIRVNDIGVTTRCMVLLVSSTRRVYGGSMHTGTAPEGTPAMFTKITDAEFDTHILPMAWENWSDAHDGRDPRDSDADWAEMQEWARLLRHGYETGEYEITWVRYHLPEH